jgi:hypothetical protein
MARIRQPGPICRAAADSADSEAERQARPSCSAQPGQGEFVE